MEHPSFEISRAFRYTYWLLFFNVAPSYHQALGVKSLTKILITSIFDALYACMENLKICTSNRLKVRNTRVLLLLSNLAIVKVFFNVLDNDSVLSQLVVDPVHQNRDQGLQLGTVKGTGLDHGTLLILFQLVLLKEIISIQIPRTLVSYRI